MKTSEESSATFLGIARILGLSILAQTQWLYQKISSTRWTHFLCDSCLNLRIQLAFNQEFRGLPSWHGIVLGTLQAGWRIDEKCVLCRTLSKTTHGTSIDALLSEARRGAVSSELDSQFPFQLRAFPLLPHLGGTQYQNHTAGLRNEVSEYFLAAVPDPSGAFSDGVYHKALRDQVAERGYLTIWCFARVVNCSTLDRHVELEYVALSYIWGNGSDTFTATKVGPQLPSLLPRVIEDAISATLSLGYRFIWVDRYCIDQHDASKKHEQIMHMDSIYQYAALTIIAAAGTDEIYGLPGVSRTRPTRQWSFKGDDFSITSTLPSPQRSIRESRWATRGWTYQNTPFQSLKWPSTSIYFEECDEDTREACDTTAQSNQLQRPRTLCIEAAPMSRNAFIRGEDLQKLCVSSGGRVDLYPSKQGLDAGEVLPGIQNGYYEVIKLATIGANSYLMLVNLKGQVAYRVGILVVREFYLTSLLFTPNVTTYHIR
ncbi:heterokaryon incompatibility protein-domain-containing protein [Xylaria digitata]|nr:heterokaryon incompatibility protein-domain-containing protein [Xylaria digitata]